MRVGHVTGREHSWRQSPQWVAKQSLPSPVNWQSLVHQLKELGYETSAIAYVERGFRCGFNLEVSHDLVESRGVLPNHQSSLLAEPQIDEQLALEVRLGRMIGPFAKPPSGSLWRGWSVAPLGAVIKDTGKARIITDLSAGADSVNERIPEEAGVTAYPSFLDVARMLYSAESDHPGGVRLSICDVESAFRNLPICPDDYRHLIFQWKGGFYVDTRLVFGVRTGPSIYNRFGAAVQFLLEKRLNVKIIRMLDDHLFVDTREDAGLDGALVLMAALGVPVATKKTVRGVRAALFLGYWWSLDALSVSVSRERWVKLLACIDGLTTVGAATPAWVSAETLRVLLGKLQWASAAVPYGRVHINSLYHALTDADANSITPREARSRSIWLGSVQLADIAWWRARCGDGAIPDRIPCVSMGDLVSPPPPDIVCHTDASGAFLGAWWCKSSGGKEGTTQWLQLEVPPLCTIQATFVLERYVHAPLELTVSSAWLECAAALAAVSAWAAGPWRGKRVQLWTDNAALQCAWSSGASGSAVVAAYLRAMSGWCHEFNVHLNVGWIAGSSNVIADRISRGQAHAANNELVARKIAPLEQHTSRSPMGRLLWCAGLSDECVWRACLSAPGGSTTPH